VSHPSECPKYHTCSAPICPLDESWRESYHANGERVCQYLLATGKAGAAEHYSDDPVYGVALELLGEIGERFPAVARGVALAARSGLRGANLRGRKPPRG
jgi:hypothetical protein